MTVKPKTVSELRAILDARAPYAAAIKAALLRGDLEGCAKAQKAMRENACGTSRRAIEVVCNRRAMKPETDARRSAGEHIVLRRLRHVCLAEVHRRWRPVNGQRLLAAIVTTGLLVGLVVCIVSSLGELS